MLRLNTLTGFGVVPASGGGGGGSDADADAFFAASGLTDGGEQFALTQFVIDLKGFGLWSLINVLYPFRGADATIASFNLKDPTQFQITWAGGPTFSVNGLTGNGASAYGDTGFSGDSAGLNNDSSIFNYTRDNSQSSALDIGAYNGASDLWGINPRTPSDLADAFQYHFSTDGFIAVSNSDSRGLFMGSRVDSSHAKLYKNGSSIGTDTTTAFPIPATSLLILSHNGSVVSSRNLALAGAGHAFNDTQAANFYTAVQNYMTTLGIQV